MLRLPEESRRTLRAPMRIFASSGTSEQSARACGPVGRNPRSRHVTLGYCKARLLIGCVREITVASRFFPQPAAAEGCWRRRVEHPAVDCCGPAPPRIMAERCAALRATPAGLMGRRVRENDEMKVLTRMRRM